MIQPIDSSTHPVPPSTQTKPLKAFHGGGAGHGSESVVVGLAHMHGDAAAASKAALKVVSAGFSEAPDRKRAVLSPHLALVADMAVTKPLRSSALKAVFRCCERRRNEGLIW